MTSSFLTVNQHIGRLLYLIVLMNPEKGDHVNLINTMMDIQALLMPYVYLNKRQIGLRTSH